MKTIACMLGLLLLPFSGVAVPNWDMSGTVYEATISYNFTTSPFPLSDSDTKTGPLLFGQQDEAGNVPVELTLAIGDGVFPINCSGLVVGNNIRVYTPEPVPGPFSYRTSFKIGPVNCILDVTLTNVVVEMDLRVASATDLDWGDGAVECDLTVTSPNCWLPSITRGYVDVTAFSATGGPAKRYMTLSGTASLGGYLGSLTTKDLLLSLSGPSPLDVPLVMNGSGAWTKRVALIPGVYTPRFSSQYYLRSALPARSLTGDTAGLNATLIGGDADSSNQVTIADLNAVLVGFGGPNPDLDGSGVVDLGDLNLVLLNFSKSGD